MGLRRIEKKEIDYLLKCKNDDETIDPTKVRIQAVTLAFFSCCNKMSIYMDEVMKSTDRNFFILCGRSIKFLTYDIISSSASAIHRLVQLLIFPTKTANQILDHYKEIEQQAWKKNIELFLAPTKKTVNETVKKTVINNLLQHMEKPERTINEQQVLLYYYFTESQSQNGLKKENPSEDFGENIEIGFRDNLLSFTQLLSSKIEYTYLQYKISSDIREITHRIETNEPNKLDLPSSIQVLQEKIVDILLSHTFSIKGIIEASQEFVIPDMHKALFLALLSTIKLMKQDCSIEEQLFIIALLNKRFDLAFKTLEKMHALQKNRDDKYTERLSSYLKLFITSSQEMLTKNSDEQNIQDLILSPHYKAFIPLISREYSSKENQECFFKSLLMCFYTDYFHTNYISSNKYIQSDIPFHDEYQKKIIEFLYHQISHNQLEKALETFDFLNGIEDYNHWTSEIKYFESIQTLCHMCYEAGKTEKAQELSMLLDESKRIKYNTDNCLYTDLYKSIDNNTLTDGDSIRSDITKLWPFPGSQENSERIIHKLSQAYLNRPKEDYQKSVKELNTYIKNVYDSEISTTPLFYILFSTLLKLHIQNDHIEDAENLLKNLEGKEKFQEELYKLIENNGKLWRSPLMLLDPSFRCNDLKRREEFIDSSLSQIAAGYLYQYKLEEAVRVVQAIKNPALKRNILYDIKKHTENNRDLIQKIDTLLSDNDAKELEQKEKSIQTDKEQIISLFKKEHDYTSILDYIEKGDLNNSEEINRILNNTFAQ